MGRVDLVGKIKCQYMDHVAKDKMLHPRRASSQHVPSHEGWYFWQGNQKHTFYYLGNWIYTFICEHHVVVVYWLRCEHLSPEATDLIDWEVLAKACDKEFLARLRWVTKHVTVACGVGISESQLMSKMQCSKQGSPSLLILSYHTLLRLITHCASSFVSLICSNTD
jgi:hypothetical protein